ncbi:MAG: zf-HC2 domain-containing protein [Cytophagaceae bacterium]|nr:zf-HC2 domain-containing protein [Gemmatimonadaceae bacterium]
MHKGVDCRLAMTQLWDFLDQELTEENMVAVRIHLEQCSACHPHAAFAQQFLTALSRCRCADPMPETLRTRVLDTLRNAGLMS